MTPEEMILTLRICGNHPEYLRLTCRECPGLEQCEANATMPDLVAADVIQNLMEENRKLTEENEKLKASERAFNAAQQLLAPT